MGTDFIAMKKAYSTRKTATPLWTKARAEAPAQGQSCRHWVRRLGVYRPGQSN